MHPLNRTGNVVHVHKTTHCTGHLIQTAHLTSFAYEQLFFVTTPK